MPKKKVLHPRPVRKKSVERKIRKDKNGAGLSLSLYINKKNGEMVVKVLDNKTLEVIKEIPSEELSDIKGQIDDAAGVLLNKKI